MWLLVGGVARAENEPAPSTAPATTTAPAPSPALDALVKEVEALKHELAAQRQALDEQRRGLEEQRALSESNLVAEPPETKQPMLRLYGFTDAGVQKLFMDDANGMRSYLPTTASTFVMGNINLYIDAQPHPDWSALIELRIANLPAELDGAGTPGRPYSLTSTRAFDATSASAGWSEVRYGAFILERAHITWQRYHLFNVRVGAILTPFGIWNLDHGSPTLISLMLPQFELAEMFPTHQVGIEAFGSQRWSTAELGYYVYVTNGRTPGEVSLSEDNKLLGGRLYLTLTGARPTRITLGASGFVARAREEERTVTSTVPLTVSTTTTVAYDEQVGGLDLSLDHKALRLRTEFTTRTVQYDTGKRALVWGQAGIYDPDHADWDYYFLAAYQLPWWGIEPYVFFEIYDYRNPISDGFMTTSVGFNIHFTANAMLKAQFADSRAFSNIDNLSLLKGPNSWFDNIAVRLVLAF